MIHKKKIHQVAQKLSCSNCGREFATIFTQNRHITTLEENGSCPDIPGQSGKRKKERKN